MSESKSEGKRIVVFVNEQCLEEEGYRPRMVVEGESGYRMQGDDDWKTNPMSRKPWFWGHDLALAQKVADDQNARMGLTPEEAARIITASMREEPES